MNLKAGTLSDKDSHEAQIDSFALDDTIFLNNDEVTIQNYTLLGHTNINDNRDLNESNSAFTDIGSDVLLSITARLIFDLDKNKNCFDHVTDLKKLKLPLKKKLVSC